MIRCLAIALFVCFTVTFADAMNSVKKKSVPKLNGFVYMNVLGKYDDTSKGPRVVLKVGQAGPNRLAPRMQEEYNAAQDLGVLSDWARKSSDDPSASLDVWKISHDPKNRGNAALPYLKITGKTNLKAAEDAILAAWAALTDAQTLSDEESLAWFAKRNQVHDQDVLRGSVKQLGATTELVAVLWDDIARVKAIADTIIEASPDGWTFTACKKAINGEMDASDEDDSGSDRDSDDEDDWKDSPETVAKGMIFDFETHLRDKVSGVDEMTPEKLVALNTLLKQLKKQVDDTFSSAPFSKKRLKKKK